MGLLTDTKARNIKPGGKPIPHGGIVGLSLHPSPTHKGHGKWVLRYVSPTSKKRRNAGLGSYPEISLADAARLARTMRDQIAQGEDPLDLKAAASSKPQTPRFQEAAQTLHRELAPGWKNAKHAQQWINTLRDYAFPIIGSLPLNAIQPEHIAAVLRPIWLEKPETASRVKQRLHAVMAWGWAQRYCQSNPVDVVTYLLPTQQAKPVRTQHQPAMPWASIPAFVATHLNRFQGHKIAQQALSFLILTAARSGEVRLMQWDEVDFENAVWTAPAEHMKAKQIHRVPLSQQAVGLLRRQQGLHDNLVFPSVRSRTPLSDMALTAFLRRVGAVSDIPGRTATAHGFRSSFRDWCSEQGYARDLAERSLAHTVKNQVEAAYHRTDLLEQRRPMMQAWADFITSDTQSHVPTPTSA